MSIETLKDDLKAVTEALPKGPLTTAAEMAVYMKNNLLPFVESVVTEMEDMDDNIGDLVTSAEDVLHEENATVFAGIITGGLALVKELEDLAAKTGDGQRLKPLIREWRELAKQGGELLEDITMPDPDPDVDLEEPADSPIAESAALPPGAKA